MIDPRIILGQLLKAREIKVPVGRFTFTIVRPTEMEIIRMRGPTGLVEVGLAMLQEKVSGWDGVLERDIVVGGANDAMPFDRALYSAWIADRPDLWPDMLKAFSTAIDDYSKSLEAIKGN